MLKIKGTSGVVVAVFILPAGLLKCLISSRLSASLYACSQYCPFCARWCLEFGWWYRSECVGFLYTVCQVNFLVSCLLGHLKIGATYSA